MIVYSKTNCIIRQTKLLAYFMNQYSYFWQAVSFWHEAGLRLEAGSFLTN